jgi:dTDP-4-dehydrorhamnose 3,5-epimerase-like enzyme
MKYKPTDIPGVAIVDVDQHRDYRACPFDADDFAGYGLNFTVSQTNTSFSSTLGTPHGLHRQMPASALTPAPIHTPAAGIPLIWVVEAEPKK